jgi:hypothetical protein
VILTKYTGINMKGLLSAAAFVVSIASMSSAQAGLIIDDFSDVEVLQWQTADDEVLTDLDVNLNNVLGFERHLEIYDISGNNGSLGSNVVLVVKEAEGSVSFNNSADVSSTGKISWKGLNQAGLGGIDLTESSINTLILLDITSADANVEMIFSVTDTFGNIATQSLSSGVGFLEFVFADFVQADENDKANSTSGLTDFTEADFLSLSLISGKSGDVSFIFVESTTPPALPEPATALIFCLGLIGLGINRRTAKVV